MPGSENTKLWNALILKECSILCSLAYLIILSDFFSYPLVEQI